MFLLRFNNNEGNFNVSLSAIPHISGLGRGAVLPESCPPAFSQITMIPGEWVCWAAERTLSPVLFHCDL